MDANTLHLFQILRLHTPLAVVRLSIPLLCRELWHAEHGVGYGHVATFREARRLRRALERWARATAVTAPVRRNSWVTARTRSDDTPILVS